jgi:hypothetical protein
MSRRPTNLTKQVGEHLVAAELGRMGYVAAPFAGNVPLFDLLAANAAGHSVPIQVKASNSGSWHVATVDPYLEIDFVGRRQVVKGKRPLPNRDLLCFYVSLRPPGPTQSEQRDEFYMLCLSDLQDLIFTGYKSRERPKNHESKHFAVLRHMIEPYRDNWPLVEKYLGARPDAGRGLRI